MRYPSQFLDRLKGHFRISEIIGKRISIKRAGREFHALCPFHNEKTPSFTINDDKGFYHCFGCGAHGDVIGFLKDYEKISYRDAIERLAREAGMALPELTPRMQEEMERSDRLYEVMDAAAGWFTQQLRRTTGSGAMDYIRRRGIEEETITQFRLGFAPAQRTALKDALMQRGISEALLKEAGLLTTPDEGSSYDKFRGRVIFPIRDSSGRVIAFGGRQLEAHENSPKYLNSPETPIFKKGMMLYNADQARREAAHTGLLLVVEGYMDAIMLYQAGFKTAVAPLGTAVTPEHLQILWRMVDTPVFCLDGDRAGERAMQRVADMALPLIKPSKSVKFAILPEGEDPDSLVHKQGKKAMERILASAIPLVDVIWHQHYAGVKLMTPEERAGAERNLFAAIQGIQDGSVQHSYKQEMKDRLWQAQALRKTPQVRQAKKDFSGAVRKSGNLNIRNEIDARGLCERMILSLAIHFPTLLEEGRVIHALEASELKGAEMDLVSAVLHIHTNGELNRSSLWASIESEGYSAVANDILQKTRHGLPKQLFNTAEDEAYPIACEVLSQLLERRELILITKESANPQYMLTVFEDAGHDKIEGLKSELESRHVNMGYAGVKES
ncbi:MAG: DNA primase [Rickettsiales bacterium]